MPVRELNLTKEQLEQLLSYDPRTGLFRWLVDMGARGREGAIAGTTDSNGYRRIKINRRLYQAHRLAWVFLHESEPPSEIDHINGDKLDNRASNLRAATRNGNCQNTSIRKDNVSGIRGVSWNSQNNKWRARCTVNKKEHLIGNFETKEEAQGAYEAFAKQNFGEFYRSNANVC